MEKHFQHIEVFRYLNLWIETINCFLLIKKYKQHSLNFNKVIK